MQKVGSRRLITLMGAWAGEKGPLYRQLADAVTGLIDRGELAGGVLLPPERALAEQLAVSRTTVVNAYQRLKDSGLVAARQGRGTVVLGKRSGPRFDDFTGEIYSAVLAEFTDVIDLTSACQTASSRLRAIVAETANLEVAIAGHGYEPQGIEALRVAVAEHLVTRGLKTDPEQLVITTGAQQAIALVASLNPSDRVVLTEEFTFPGALDAFRRLGLRPIGVPMDDGGVSPRDLRDAVARHKPALVYLTPSFGNPTGSELARSRRAEILETAADTGVTILEDNTLELLSQGRPALPPLATGHKGGKVVTVGSLSKAVWGGLRIGWARADPTVAKRIARAKTVSDIGSPILNQALAVPVVSALPELAAEMVVRVGEAHAASAAGFAELLPGWVCPLPRGGLCSWVHAPGVDINALAQLAQRHGVVITPGSIFSPAMVNTDHFRLPLIYPPKTMERAVRRIAAAAAELAGQPSRQ